MGKKQNKAIAQRLARLDAAIEAAERMAAAQGDKALQAQAAAEAATKAAAAAVAPPAPAPRNDYEAKWSQLRAAGRDFEAAQFYNLHSRKILAGR